MLRMVHDDCLFVPCPNAKAIGNCIKYIAHLHLNINTDKSFIFDSVVVHTYICLYTFVCIILPKSFLIYILLIDYARQFPFEGVKIQSYSLALKIHI